DPKAIAEVREQAWPDVRSADELHDVLQELIAVPEALPDLSPFGAGGGVAAWGEYFGALVDGRRAARSHRDAKAFWVAAEKAQEFSSLFPDARFESQLPELQTGAASREIVLSQCIGGWLSHVCPATR